MSGDKLTVAIFACCFLWASPLRPQEVTIPSHVWKEAGLPYIQNFSPKDYSGGIQNFMIAQDERGLLYFGNNWGVLIYDGVSWRLIRMPNQSAVRSLCLVKGRIYVGAVGELGYLEPDASGQLRYNSLLKDIPEENRDFKDVYTIHAIGEAVYFRTRHTIFRWTNDQIRVWRSTKNLFGAFVINDNYYSGQQGVGLMQMVEDSLRLLRGGEMFADKSVRFMLPYGNSQIIGTFAHGLFLYDGSGIKKFSTSVDDFLVKNQLRDAANLPGGLIALATARGVVIIDKAGNLCQMVNKASGLRGELVISLFSDRQDGLWLGLNNGIARIETPAPISRFQARSGIESFVQSIVRHNGRLYTTTPQGVSYLDKTAFPFPLFKPVTGISTLAWSLLSVGKHLLAGTQNGIFEITKNSAKKINSLSAIRLHSSKEHSNLVFAGLLDGLAVLRLSNNAWQNLGRVAGISERIIAITEDENGSLWLGTQSEGVLQLNLPLIDATGMSRKKIFSGVRIKRFGKQHGLPVGPVSPYLIGAHLVFETRRGLRRFDVTQQQFIPDSTFGMMFADTLCRISDVREDPQGNVWFVAGTGDDNFVSRGVPQSDGAYQWQETPFLRMNDLGRVYFSYPEKSGMVWFGGAEGIARYTPDIPKDFHADFATVIRRVSGISIDSVFYHGAALTEFPQPVIEHKNNSLRFEFAAMSYDAPSANRYQVKLDGFDADWSNWSNETKKDYTGLPAGDYTFRVHAKNVYEHLGREGIFSFTILPPWYQTWWAFIIYALFTATCVFAIVKSRVRHFEKKTRELEFMVAERTGMIRDQAEKLRELDKMKSRFFANISHEFRTPLTLILGPLEERIARAKKKADKEEFSMMHRSGQRLLRLINELLDLSRLESGKMKLNASRGDFIAFLKGIVMSFASLAEQKKITLQFEPCEGFEPSQGFSEVYFDPDKIEKIFSNLLSNAFKFTPAGGEIHCRVQIANCQPERRSEIQSPKFELECQCIEISVKDTGIGIPADRLPHIFDRFYQIDSTTTRDYEGTGIGLALTKELVVLHHGSIEVESEEGHGTTFTVHLPLGKEYLSEEEIVSDTSDIKQSATSIEHPASSMEQPTSILEPATSIQEPASSSEDIILVVDDHPDVRNYVRKHLETGYRIIEAKDGQQGVEMAIEAIPDLVISDVMMPKLDGNQLCEALKTNEKTSHIPVILLTAKAGEEDKLAGLETGADDYLTKPFSAKELQARVRNLIEQRRKLRARFVREGILQPREVAVTSTDEAFLHKLMNEIEENLAEEDFGVEELSLKVNMSARQLHRKVHALTERTPVELIRSVRLQRARQLLEQKAGSISEIAYQVGFSNLSYFARMFKEEFGKLPSEI